jgi:hypothetical protein
MSLKLITEHKDYLLLVDTEAAPAKRDFFIVMYNDESYLDILVNPIEDFRNYADEDYIDECYKIIAHLPLNNAPVLEGVYLLPELPKQEEDVEELANQYYKEEKAKGNLFELNYGWKKAFIAGYKATTKKWTDEDMIDMFVAGYHCDGKNDLLDNLGKKYLQSLSPTLVPIGFEPELDWKDTLLPYRDLSKRQYKVINNILQGIYKFKE